MTVPKHSAVQAAFAFSFESLAREVAPLPSPEAVAAEAMLDDTPGKACKVCGVWKPFTEFSPQASGAGGHKAKCKPCFNAGVAAAKLAPKTALDPDPVDADGNPTAKRCKACGEMKPLGEFATAKLGKYGRVADCKACNNAAWKAGYTPKRPPPPPVPLDDEGKPLTKRCRGCGETKPLDAFHLNPDCQHGRAPKCRVCEKELRINPKPRRQPEPAGFKRCTKCGETKYLQEFSPDSRGRCGVFARCRLCHRDHYVPREPDPALDRANTSRACTRCGETKPLTGFNKAPKGPDGYAHECKVCGAINSKRWVQNNMPRVLAATAERRAAQIQAMPAWLTPAHLAEIEGHYQYTDLFAGHEVDHAVPLRGQVRERGKGAKWGRKQIVCGLHVGHNLQALTVAENRAKGSKIIPGMERAEANEYGTRRPIWDAASWWDTEWAAMGFG